MFGGFEDTHDAQARRRWFASTGTSAVIFVAAAIGLAVLARQTAAISSDEASIDVTFHAAPEPELKPEPPPPPPPPPPKAVARTRRPGAAAPAAPKAIPAAAPAEAEPTTAVDATAMQAEYGDGDAPAKPAVAAPPPPPPVETRRPDPPVYEDDPGAIPPSPRADNALPIYPETARHRGIEAEVILKVEISAAGEVLSAKVIRGDEPFATAALTAVRAWRYAPATLDGKPVRFIRLVKIPFRLH